MPLLLPLRCHLKMKCGQEYRFARLTKSGQFERVGWIFGNNG